MSNSILNNSLVLDAQNCVPHLSLCKLLVHKDKILDLKNEINNFMLKNKFPSLSFDSVSSGSVELEKTTAIILRMNSDLVLFQSKLTKLVSSFNVDTNVVSSMFNENVNLLTINWTQSAISNVFRNYNAHISLGFGKVEINKLDFDLCVAGIVTTQSGNYCCCKK